MAIQEFSGLMKYKDANGNLNLLLPITSKDNVDGLDEIENKLAEAVTYTEQTLTDEQKAQARANIGANPNWNASEGEPGYIEGRTHYEEGTGEVLFDRTFALSRGYANDLYFESAIVDGKCYTIELDGVKYIRTAYTDAEGYINVGALYDAETKEYDYTDTPFAIFLDRGVKHGLAGLPLVDGDHTLKVVDGATHTLDEKFIPDTIARTSDIPSIEGLATESYVSEAISNIDIPTVPTPNWNASEGEPGYIEGRTHYEEGTGEVLYEDTLGFSNKRKSFGVTFTSPIVDGKYYTVEVDGVKYIRTAYTDAEGSVTIGALFDSENQVYDYTDTPFVIYLDDGLNHVICSDVLANGDHTIKVVDGAAHPLDEKYIPETIARISDIPSTLPNPNALTINGTTYDGSEAVEINAPALSSATVGQTIRVKAVDENGKPTEWEAVDYQPRTHWEGPGEVVLFEGSVDTTSGPDKLSGFLVEIGKKYNVLFDGVLYENLIGFDDDGFNTIGEVFNIEADDYIWTEYPFVITGPSGSTRYTLNAQTAGEHTLKIYINEIVAYPIDEKYLPGPKLLGEIVLSSANTTFTSNLDESEIQFNDEVTAQMVSVFTKMKEISKPVFVEATISGLNIRTNLFYSQGSSGLGVRESLAFSFMSWTSSEGPRVGHAIILEDCMFATADTQIKLALISEMYVKIRFYV